jgi:hypothetical protein
VTEPKGKAAAEISRGLFNVQLRFADVFSVKAGMPLAEAITWHTNFHRLFAYGNLSKEAPDPEFLALVDRAIAAPDPAARLDRFVAAYADRPHDPWPSDRFPFGKHFACEAPNADGVVRIHFRNRVNDDATGPLHASRIAERRADLTEMFGHVARAWPQARSVMGASWLYNTEGYRRLFPKTFADSRTPLLGPRPIHGLSTWGQFLDFRGAVKPQIAEAFYQNLKTLDPSQPWLSFPYQVLTTTAPFEAFRREYGV